jgi:HEAT repeat protein
VAENSDGENLSDSETPQVGGGEALPEAYAKNAVQFVVNAHAATVNMRLYPTSSSMVTETFSKANDALVNIFETSDGLSVATIENNLLINDVRMDDIDQQKAPVKSFVAWMHERGLSIIEFRKGITGEELQTFFTILSEMADTADRTKLTDELLEQGVEHISVNQRVYVAVTTDESGEIVSGSGGPASPLDALKDELLMRYLMGKVDLHDVEDRELVDVLSDPGKVGGLLSRFLGEEGMEGGVFMKSQKAEEALNSLSEMVNEIGDEELREAMAGKVTNIIAEMSPREMTSVLSGRPPAELNIRHIRENVIKILSDNQLLDMIDSLIDEYSEMKDEVGELETTWTKERLQDLNELLMEVRTERGAAISETIDRKLDEAGIQEERDPGTGTRVLSAYEMLGGPLEEEVIELSDGVDLTVPRQIRQLYAMEETDLAAGMLLKVAENFTQDSDKVRRFATRLVKETLDGLDEEHAVEASDILRPRVMESMRGEKDYQTFEHEVDSIAVMAGAYMKAGRVDEASEIIEVLNEVSAEDAGKGEELTKHAATALKSLMGPEGMIDAEALLLEEDEPKRLKTIKALASLGPEALAPLVDMVKDRGQIELRDRALEAIQVAGVPGIKALLGELEKENPWYIYRNILNVVADLRLTQGLPQVTAMVTNPDERIRREAVRSLARIGAKDSLGAVMNAANDQSVAVRKTAVRVLGLFGDASVATYLLDIINGTGLRGKDEDQGVVEAACLALGDLHDKSYVPQLAELLGKGGLFKKGRPDEIRAAACLALGGIGDQSAMPVLERAVKDQSQMVRASAEKAIRRLKGGVTAPEPMSLEEATEVLGAPPPQPEVEVGRAEPVPPPPEEPTPATEPAIPEQSPEVYQAPAPVESPEAYEVPAPVQPPEEFAPPAAPEAVPEAQQPVAPPARPEPAPPAEPYTLVAPPSPVEQQAPALEEPGYAEPPQETRTQQAEPPVEEVEMPKEFEEATPPTDPSTLEYFIMEHGEGAPGAGAPPSEATMPPAPLTPETPAFTESSQPAPYEGASTLEEMILGTEAPAEETLELPPEGDELRHDLGPSTMETLVGESPGQTAPPEPGHTAPSSVEVPPDVAQMWPEGSLNGHDHPLPPVPGEAPGEQGEQVDALPSDDDYAPGRTDQPSTMERMLGPDEKPAPEDQGPPPGPPQAPPPASGWK